MKSFLSLSPTFVFEFFTTYIVDNFKVIIDLLLICPDKVVRAVIASIMAYCINILIAFHDLPLLEDAKEIDEHRNKVNYAVIEFLNNYLALMPNDVAKNWNKFQQYFDVLFRKIFRND